MKRILLIAGVLLWATIALADLSLESNQRSLLYLVSNPSGSISDENNQRSLLMLYAFSSESNGSGYVGSSGGRVRGKSPALGHFTR